MIEFMRQRGLELRCLFFGFIVAYEYFFKVSLNYGENNLLNNLSNQKFNLKKQNFLRAFFKLFIGGTRALVV